VAVSMGRLNSSATTIPLIAVAVSAREGGLIIETKQIEIKQATEEAKSERKSERGARNFMLLYDNYCCSTRKCSGHNSTLTRHESSFFALH
jgi:hypothetical protein